MFFFWLYVTKVNFESKGLEEFCFVPRNHTSLVEKRLRVSYIVAHHERAEMTRENRLLRPQREVATELLRPKKGIKTERSSSSFEIIHISSNVATRVWDEDNCHRDSCNAVLAWIMRTYYRHTLPPRTADSESFRIRHVRQWRQTSQELLWKRTVYICYRFLYSRCFIWLAVGSSTLTWLALVLFCTVSRPACAQCFFGKPLKWKENLIIFLL